PSRAGGGRRGRAGFGRPVLPLTHGSCDGVRGRVPTIYFGTGTAGLLELMARADSDLLSVDWRLPLDEAWVRIGLDRGVQGNLDPIRPLAGWAAAEAGMKDVLARAGRPPRHAV